MEPDRLAALVKAVRRALRELEDSQVGDAKATLRLALAAVDKSPSR